MDTEYKFPMEYVLSEKELANRIKEGGKRFCFVLGSGASKESGIADGKTMSKSWMDCIMGVAEDRGTPKMDTDTVRARAAILRKKKKLKHGFDAIEKAWKEAREKNEKTLPSEYYFDIYKLRFFADPSSGYRYLEREMENKSPSAGYYVLSRILTDDGRSNLVITTNFDSLTEDALYLYTDKKPLVISHEALADFITPNITRPMVAKLHRGLMFDPLNSPEDTSKLRGNWANILGKLFSIYTPVVIGYNGGDSSLMSFLEKRSTKLPNGIYWCYRDKPDKRVRRLVRSKDGYLVQIKGFDHLMLQIGSLLYPDDIGPDVVRSFLEKRSDEQSSIYEKQYCDFLKTQTPGSELHTELEKADKAIESGAEPDGWSLYRQGNREYDAGNFDKAIDCYTLAIDKGFSTAAVYNNRGITYDELGAYDEAIADFSKAIADYNKAIADYNKAIELDPTDAATYYNRGNAYYELDAYDEAIADYSRAIELDPTLAAAYYNRGITYEKLGKYDKAIADYSKAIELDPYCAGFYRDRAEAYRKVGTPEAIKLAEADEKRADELEKQSE